mgnify:FL=1
MHFGEGINNRFIPRAVLFDLEPGVIDSVRASSFAKMFKLDNYIVGQGNAGNNWSRGHYTEGAEMIDEVMDAARR